MPDQLLKTALCWGLSLQPSYNKAILLFLIWLLILSCLSLGNPIGGRGVHGLQRLRYSWIPDSKNHWKKQKQTEISKATYLTSNRDHEEQIITVILCKALVLCTNVRSQKYIVYSLLSQILYNRPSLLFIWDPGMFIKDLSSCCGSLSCLLKSPYFHVL